MRRRLVAEALGTLLLLVAVVGSGITAERLAGGNMAVALLANALATGAALVVLITVLGPLSGAHFNPCVSLYAALRREMTWRQAGLYAATQFAAAVCGVAEGVCVSINDAVFDTPEEDAGAGSRFESSFNSSTSPPIHGSSFV